MGRVKQYSRVNKKTHKKEKKNKKRAAKDEEEDVMEDVKDDVEVKDYSALSVGKKKQIFKKEKAKAIKAKI